MLCLVAQSCPTLCGPRYCSPPGSSAHEVFLARTVEWIAISYSRGSSWPRDRACIPCISCTGKWILYRWQHRGSPPTGEVWSMHNVDTQHTLWGERPKGRENAFRLNLSWLAIKYEFYFMWEVTQAKHYFPHRRPRSLKKLERTFPPLPWAAESWLHPLLEGHRDERRQGGAVALLSKPGRFSMFFYQTQCPWLSV